MTCVSLLNPNCHMSSPFAHSFVQHQVSEFHTSALYFCRRALHPEDQQIRQYIYINIYLMNDLHCMHLHFGGFTLACIKKKTLPVFCCVFSAVCLQHGIQYGAINTTTHSSKIVHPQDQDFATSSPEPLFNTLR